MFRVSALLAGLTAIATLTTSCSRSGGATEVQPAKAAELPSVAVTKAKIDNLSQSLVLTAEFKPFQEIDIMAKVAGYIKTIGVDVGDRVRQGQLLAVLEIPEMADDLARAQAAVDRSQAEVARAKDELQRAQSVHELSHVSFTRLSSVAKQREGLIAQQEIDDAQSKDVVSEAQVSGAKSNLTAAEQQVRVNTAELQKVKTLAEYARVTAPFDGVITKRFADTGSMIQAGISSSTQAMPVVRLSENNLLRLIVPVPESAVPAVRIGQAVEVRVPSLNRGFPGRVARISGKVSLATRTMDTEVDVPNPSLVLVPGMYAEVNLTLDSRHGVVAVPVSAVDMSEKNALGRALVVTPQNRIEARDVRLGLETADSIQISSGIQPGEMVIIGSRTGLQSGQMVQPKLTSLGATKTP